MYRLRRKDTGASWVCSYNLAPIRDADGCIAGAVVTGRDITESLQAEERQAHLKDMLARTEQIAQVGSWEWQLDADRVTWSDELYRLLDRDPAQGPLTAAETDRVFTAASSEQLDRVVATSINDGVPFELELDTPHHDGTTRRLLARGYPLKADDGHVSSLYGFMQDITEQRQAEEALRERELQLRSLGDNLPNGFVFQYEVTNGESKFRYLSAGIERTLGLIPEQVIADAGRLFALIPESARAESQLAESRSAKTLSDYAMLLPFDLPHGQRRWLQVQSRPRRISADAILWDGVALDVTDQHSAELRLQESEQRFRRLFEDTQQATLLLEDGRFIAANRAALSLLSMNDPSQLIGRTPAELSPTLQPDGRPSAEKAAELIERTFHQGSSVFEWEHLRADGEHVSLEVLLTVVHSGDKALLHCVGIDITDKKRIESELERYHKALESLVAQRTTALQQSNTQLAHTQFAMDRAGIGIAWNNAETGQFLYANDEICRQLGYTREEILQLTVSDINPEFSLRALRQLTAEMRAGGGVVQIETLHRRKDQSTYPAAVTVYLHQAVDEEWFIAFTHDITERKRVEAELIQTRDAAQAANRAKSAFLANMSHEIRTPLNAVLGMAQLLLIEGVTPIQADRISKIEMAGRHLLDIISAILDLSKIEAGKLQLESTDFALATLLGEVRDLVLEPARAKGLGISLELDEALPHWVRGDATRLRQALLNYASNAVKFTQHGEIVLRARLLGEDDKGLSVRFEVQDAGAGIAPEVLPRLFSAFEQGDTSTTRKYGGTGLGLAITRRLARLMGGEAGVHSVPEQGSCFWIGVRLTSGLAPIPEGERPCADLVATLRTHHAETRVLIVEDEPVNLELAKALLENAGLVVDTAADGGAAVERARGGTYALILMDIRLPRLDGLEAALAIRALPRWHDRPILAMTANVFTEDRQACLAAGMNDFLAKPVRPKDLYAKVLRWLAQTTADAAGDRSLALRASDAPTTGAEATSMLAQAPSEGDAKARILGQIATLLGASDTAALSVCKAHASLLAEILGRDFGRFMHCVNTFDLDTALEILQTETPRGARHRT